MLDKQPGAPSFLQRGERGVALERTARRFVRVAAQLHPTVVVSAVPFCRRNENVAETGTTPMTLGVAVETITRPNGPPDQTLTVTRRNVAGIDVVSPLELVFWLAKSSSSSA